MTLALAASGTWRGALNSRWNEDGNWTGAAFPNAPSEAATFDDQAGVPHLVAIDGVTVTIGSITIDSAAGYTLTAEAGGRLVFDVTSGSAALNVNNTSGDAAHTILAPVTLADNLVVTNNSTGTLVLSNVGQSGGSRSLTKAGAGPLALVGQGSYAGGTTVNAGALALGDDSAAGAGRITLNANTALRSTVGPRVLANPIRINANGVTFDGPASLAFTSLNSDISNNRQIVVETTTSFAKIVDPTGCCRNLRKGGNGALNLNLSGTNNVGAFIRNDSGGGQLNLYGSGTIGQIVYNPGTGGGELGIGDTMDVATRAITHGVGTLTVRGWLVFGSNTPAASNTSLRFDLDGTGYDQILVTQYPSPTGDRSYVELNQTVLQLFRSPAFTPTIGTTFTLISRTGGQPGDAINGTFRDLPDGSVVWVDGLKFLITYTPDAVTLTRVDIQTGSDLAASGGTPQSAVVVTPFAVPLQVSVTNSDGTPQPHVRVAFYPPAAGASLTFPGGADWALTDAFGQASLTATANTIAGSYVVTANIAPAAVLTPARFELTNLPGPAATLEIAGFGAPVNAGTSQPFDVIARDAYGNQAAGYLGTLSFASDDPRATLPADYTYTPGDGGSHTFNVTLRTAGTRTLTATDALNGLTAVRSDIQVNALPALYLPFIVRP